MAFGATVERLISLDQGGAKLALRPVWDIVNGQRTALRDAPIRSFVVADPPPGLDGLIGVRVWLTADALMYEDVKLAVRVGAVLRFTGRVRGDVSAGSASG